MNASRTLAIILVLNLLIAAGSIYFNFTLYESIKVAQQTSTDGELESKPKLAEKSDQKATDFLFHTVEKIIFSSKLEETEHYFVIDAVLQASIKEDKKKLEKIDPAVRASIITYLSNKPYSELRAQSISELQANIEAAVFDDFKERGIATPFKHILISKLLVQ